MAFITTINFTKTPNTQKQNHPPLKQPSFQGQFRFLKNEVQFNKTPTAAALKAQIMPSIQKLNSDFKTEIKEMRHYWFERDWLYEVNMCIDNGLGIKLPYTIINSFNSNPNKVVAMINTFSLIRDRVWYNNFAPEENNVTPDDKLNNANEYLNENFDKLYAALYLLGQEVVLAALNFKQDRFQAFIDNANSYYNTTEDIHRQLLWEKVEPKRTSLYRSLIFEKSLIKNEMRDSEFSDFIEQHENNKIQIKTLETKLKQLKQNFLPQNKQKIKEIYSEITALRKKDYEKKPNSFKELEKQMTNVKAKLNSLLQNAINDPLEKIQLLFIHQLVPAKNYSTLMKELNSVMIAGGDFYKKTLIKLLSGFLELNEEEQKTLADLNIADSYYFLKLFQIFDETKVNLKKLISTISNYNGNIEKAFDNLEQNKITRKLFEERNLNYDVWSKYNAENDYIKIDENTIIRKVNMNDIKHSLFLGNQVGCCTAIDARLRGDVGPNFIMNKFVQAIELIVDNVPIANTMCYMAEFDNNDYRLVLDNIKAIEPFKNDPQIFNYFKMFAEKMLKDINAPEAKVSTGFRYNIPIPYKNLNSKDIIILGTSREREIRLDTVDTTSIFPLEKYHASFYV